MTARTIQLFAPGIPQVYYVGLLAGRNDFKLVEHTKNGRDINRHNYTLDEIASDIQKPVVRRLLRLMEFRNSYPAFNGEFTVGDTRDDQLQLRWKLAPYEAVADIDLKGYRCCISYFDVKSLKNQTLMV